MNSDMDTRSHSVDRSPITASTERAHGGQGQHTPAPWRVECRPTPNEIAVVQEGGYALAWMDHAASPAEANAARIVACVNACDGMGDPARDIARLAELNAELRKRTASVLGKCDELERGLAADNDALRIQRDELAAALRDVFSAAGHANTYLMLGEYDNAGGVLRGLIASLAAALASHDATKVHP